MIEEAQKEAGLIIENAEKNARTIRENAEKEVERIKQNGYKEIYDLILKKFNPLVGLDDSNRDIQNIAKEIEYLFEDSNELTDKKNRIIKKGYSKASDIIQQAREEAHSIVETTNNKCKKLRQKKKSS